MPTFSVAVTRAADYVEGFGDRLVDLSIALDHLHPSVAADRRCLTVRLAITSNDIDGAIKEAIAATERALAVVELPFVSVIGIEALEWDEFERRVDAPSPRFVGITELAEMIGITRQRASALARTSKFPAPAAELASGPVWFEANVRRFVDEWDRKPGRPRKDPGIVVHHDPAFQEMGGGMTAADIPLPE